MGVYETLGGEFASRFIGLSSASTSYVFSALGACGAVTLVCFSRLVKYHDEVRLTIGGVYLMVVSCVMMSVAALVAGSAHSSLLTSWFLLAVCAMYATGGYIVHTSVF